MITFTHIWKGTHLTEWRRCLGSDNHFHSDLHSHDRRALQRLGSCFDHRLTHHLLNCEQKFFLNVYMKCMYHMSTLCPRQQANEDKPSGGNKRGAWNMNHESLLQGTAFGRYDLQMCPVCGRVPVRLFHSLSWNRPQVLGRHFHISPITVGASSSGKSLSGDVLLIEQHPCAADCV